MFKSPYLGRVNVTTRSPVAKPPVMATPTTPHASSTATAYGTASRRLAAGRPLSAGLRDSGVFPHLLVQLVSVGEESGSLDEMPGKCAEIHEAQVEDAVDNLATSIEPALTAVLGVVVGGLIVAMYLPVFELGSVFSG